MTTPAGEPGMKGYYAARAGEYDAIYRKPERQSDLRAIEAWLAPIFAGARVLEVACGTGYWTQFIAPSAASVRAIDSSAETMRIAAERVNDRRVSFEVGDAYALPRSEPPCDAAFAGHWLSHVPRARCRAFLAGLHAVLAPGATMVLLDNRYVEGSSTPVSEVDAAGDTWQMRTLVDGSRHRVLKNFPDEAALRTLVEGLGTDAVYTSWPHYWALRYRTA